MDCRSSETTGLNYATQYQHFLFQPWARVLQIVCPVKSKAYTARYKGETYIYLAGQPARLITLFSAMPLQEKVNFWCIVYSWGQAQEKRGHQCRKPY